MQTYTEGISQFCLLMLARSQLIDLKRVWRRLALCNSTTGRLPIWHPTNEWANWPDVYQVSSSREAATCKPFVT